MHTTVLNQQPGSIVSTETKSTGEQIGAKNIERKICKLVQTYFDFIRLQKEFAKIPEYHNKVIINKKRALGKLLTESLVQSEKARVNTLSVTYELMLEKSRLLPLIKETQGDITLLNLILDIYKNLKIKGRANHNHLQIAVAGIFHYCITLPMNDYVKIGCALKDASGLYLFRV